MTLRKININNIYNIFHISTYWSINAYLTYVQKIDQVWDENGLEIIIIFMI